MIKTVLLLLLFNLTYPTTSFPQKGFKTIQKAETKYEKGKYLKALNLLNKTDHGDYGFCGNVWMGANYLANKLRCQIYIKLENYQMARNNLDSIIWYHQGQSVDSLKIRTYQLQYGAKKLAENIDTSLQNVSIICTDYSCYAQIPILDQPSFIKLKINSSLYFKLNKIKNNALKLQLWIEDFKKSKNYVQLIHPMTN